MPPLPSEMPIWMRDHPKYSNIVSAYGVCLRLEGNLQEQADSGKDTTKAMIYCRILGCLFHHAPTKEALNILTDEVVSAKKDNDDGALLKVGEMYFNHLIRAFRSNKGHTPTPSDYTSPASFDRLADLKKVMLQEASLSHQTVKKHALVRDGFQCVVTKVYDQNILELNTELAEIVLRNGVRPGLTHCTHIFPESTTTKSSDKYATSVWTILDRFGYKGILEELNGPKIHRLENVITLHGDLHDSFDRLKIWFTATDEPNTYRLEAIYDWLLVGYPTFVTFSSPDPEKLPLPNAAYLRIHAVCAKVAHLSGAAKYLETIWSYMEEILVLDEDGGSAELLDEAILSSAMGRIIF